MFSLLLTDPLQKSLRDIGGGHGTYTVEGNHQAAVFLDPADDSFRSLELSVGHPHTLATMKLGIILPEELHSLLAGRSNQHEDIHFPFGDGKRYSFQALQPCVQDYLIRELSLYLQSMVDSGTEEHERIDDRTADFLLHAVMLHQDLLARNIGLNLVFLQQVLYLKNFVIKYFQGKPMFAGTYFYVQRKVTLQG